MKKVGLTLLLLFVLTGCSDTSKELQNAMMLRDRLLSQGCSFEAEITADYGDSVSVFAMSCTADAQGNLTFSVTKPDSIAGITGKLTDSGGVLTFDDKALYFDLLTEEQLSPISGPWILLKTLRSGYLNSACMEEELIHLSVNDSYEEDALYLDIWLDTENCPVRAEILHEDRKILSLDVSNFRIG